MEKTIKKEPILPVIQFSAPLPPSKVKSHNLCFEVKIVEVKQFLSKSISKIPWFPRSSEFQYVNSVKGSKVTTYWPTSVGANQFLHFQPQASKLQNLFLSRAILFSIKLPYSLQSNLLFSKSPYFLQSYIIFPCVNP